jgi:phage terminase large subunit-like protein
MSDAPDRPRLRVRKASHGSTREAGETGIVVAGRSADGHAYVIEDATARGAPATWATAAINAYVRNQADLIVREVNNGGDMVGYTLASIDPACRSPRSGPAAASSRGRSP